MLQICVLKKEAILKRMIKFNSIMTGAVTRTCQTPNFQSSGTDE